MYMTDVTRRNNSNKYNAIIITVAHDIFKDIVIENYKKTNDSIVYDVKGILNRKLVTKRFINENKIIDLLKC